MYDVKESCFVGESEVVHVFRLVNPYPATRNRKLETLASLGVAFPPNFHPEQADVVIVYLWRRKGNMGPTRRKGGRVRRTRTCIERFRVSMPLIPFESHAVTFPFLQPDT